jgi:hypothetical protein
MNLNFLWQEGIRHAAQKQRAKLGFDLQKNKPNQDIISPRSLFLDIRPFPFFIPVIPLVQLVHACRAQTVGKGQMGVDLKIAVHIIPEAFIIPDFFAM